MHSFSAFARALDLFTYSGFRRIFTLPGLPHTALFNNLAYLCRIAIHHDVPL